MNLCFLLIIESAMEKNKAPFLCGFIKVYLVLS